MANVSVIFSYSYSMVLDSRSPETGRVLQGKFQGSPSICNKYGALSRHIFVPSWHKAVCEVNKQLYLQFVMYTKAYITCVKFTVT